MHKYGNHGPAVLQTGAACHTRPTLWTVWSCQGDIRSPSKCNFSFWFLFIKRCEGTVWGQHASIRQHVCWPIGSKSLRVLVWPLLLGARSAKVLKMKIRRFRSRNFMRDTSTIAQKSRKEPCLESERNYINRKTDIWPNDDFRGLKQGNVTITHVWSKQ